MIAATDKTVRNGLDIILKIVAGINVLVVLAQIWNSGIQKKKKKRRKIGNFGAYIEVKHHREILHWLNYYMKAIFVLKFYVACLKSWVI